MKKLLTYMLSILLVLSFAPNVNAIAPQITNIPDQTIDEGQTFETIKLDDFVSDVEDADNVLSWIAEDQSELAVSISNRIATITTPSADWNGQETITFRVTDSESLEDEDSHFDSHLGVIPIINK